MKLLMHMCCGPCSVYPAEVLKDENIDFEGFFYNPNIHPWDEYVKRRENVERFARIEDIAVHFTEGFQQDKWESFSGEDIDRCRMCYALRLDKAAEFAADKGFDAFTTTLLVSPYQNHDMIMELGGKLGMKHGVDFYYRDFRPGFRKGQQKAREMELYRQKFCGCIISYAEAQNRLKK